MPGNQLPGMMELVFQPPPSPRPLPRLLLLLLFVQQAPAPAQPADKERNPAWQETSSSALLRGNPGDWDDFSIGSPCVLRTGNAWQMYYEGRSLDEDGYRSAFGMASSDDAVSWKKHSQNPLLQPDIETSASCAAFSVTSGSKSLVGAFAVQRSLFQHSQEELNKGVAWLSFVESTDGVVWQACHPAVSLDMHRTHFPLAPSLYHSDQKLHLWWFGLREGLRVLNHSISDGAKWSKPNWQPAGELSERELCCARVVPSGNYLLLSAVEKAARPRVVTFTSRNGRTWHRAGPPPFELESHTAHSAPFLVFTAEGARLYYSSNLADGGSHLHSAFCPKSAYVR
ncbi:MAG: hypothetical protein ACR2IE_02750 [Candidatus Sumerlaeaceae bacterium]